jgi:hypothetical protein
MIASEPIFVGNWHECPHGSILSVGENLEILSIDASPTNASQ